MNYKREPIRLNLAELSQAYKLHPPNIPIFVEGVSDTDACLQRAQILAKNLGMKFVPISFAGGFDGLSEEEKNTLENEECFFFIHGFDDSPAKEQNEALFQAVWREFPKNETHVPAQKGSRFMVSSRALMTDRKDSCFDSHNSLRFLVQEFESFLK